MTDEELKLQMNILASKTDSNPNMPYKANATLNKGLNPTYFTGQSTKIVNAINDLASKVNNSTMVAQNVADKVNEILLDITTTDNAPIWANVKELMGKDTIIEGIESILEGVHADKILGLTPDDIDKVLSVGADENGNPVIQAIDKIVVGATDIKYFNDKAPSVSNIKAALDYLFNNMGSGGDGGLGGGVIVGEITWDMIDDKPMIANKMTLEDDRLKLVDSEGTIMSSVQIMNDKDVETLLQELGAEE